MFNTGSTNPVFPTYTQSNVITTLSTNTRLSTSAAVYPYTTTSVYLYRPANTISTQSILTSTTEVGISTGTAVSPTYTETARLYFATSTPRPPLNTHTSHSKFTAIIEKKQLLDINVLWLLLLLHYFIREIDRTWAWDLDHSSSRCSAYIVYTIASPNVIYNLFQEEKEMHQVSSYW